MWAPDTPTGPTAAPGPAPTTRQPAAPLGDPAARTASAPTAAVPPTATPPPGSPWQAPATAPRPAPMRPPRMREHWNWAGGAVIAQFVVLAALTALAWAASSEGPTLAGASDTDLTVAGIIVSGGAGVALLGAVLLAGRSAAVPALFTLLAGLLGAGGAFFEPINDWSGFLDTNWEAQVGWAVPAAVPLVLGFVALGLRRLAKPHAID